MKNNLMLATIILSLSAMTGFAQEENGAPRHRDAAPELQHRQADADFDRAGAPPRDGNDQDRDRIRPGRQMHPAPLPPPPSHARGQDFEGPRHANARTGVDRGPASEHAFGPVIFRCPHCGEELTLISTSRDDRLGENRGPRENMGNRPPRHGDFRPGKEGRRGSRRTR